MIPKVSIIIPCYNSAKTIRRAIDSVRTQDFEEWELIIVNDGSTDNTVDIIQHIEDARIKVFHQKNGGASSARNKGIAYAQGEWICFLDSDDILTPYAIRTLLSETNEENDIVIGCRIIGHPIPPSEPPYRQSVSVEPHGLALGCLFWEKKMEEIRMLFSDSLSEYGINLGAPWAKLYRKDLLISKKINFNEHLVLHEDTLFNHQAYLHAKSIRLISTPVYCYLDNPNSLTRSKNKKYREHCVSAMSQFLILHPELPEELLYFSMFRIMECWKGIVESTPHSLFRRYQQIKQLRNIENIQPLISHMPLKNNPHVSHYDKLELFLFKHRLLFSLIFLTPIIHKLRS